MNKIWSEERLNQLREIMLLPECTNYIMAVRLFRRKYGTRLTIEGLRGTVYIHKIPHPYIFHLGEKNKSS